MNVTVWNEFVHENINEAVKAIYPQGIHNAIGDFLKEDGYNITTATLKMPEHGLTSDVLNNTDVLIWWGHIAHGKVSDDIVDKVYDRVQDGMGLIVLHSGHESKLFKKLCGTQSGKLKWRESGEKEIVWVVDYSHPIVEGLGEKIVIPEEETYGEPFSIPTPDELVFISWFEGGEVFRSGCTFKRGNGKIFYFKPGHETFPIYHMPEIQKVIKNAVKWAKPLNTPKKIQGHCPTPAIKL